MIPLRDDIPSRRFPYVNTALIAANVAVFAYELVLADRGGLGALFGAFGVVPALVLATGPDAPGLLERTVPLLTSMFLHGGWAHIIGNMLYLYIFGDNVEDRMGHGRYLGFYLLCGLVAGGAHILTNPASTVPTVGASGAVAGVLGAYLVLYPRARVVALLPLGIVLQVVRLPALLFLGFWFVQQFLLGAVSLGRDAAAGGVAFWAHVGGFLAGAALVRLFRRGTPPPGPDLWWEERLRRRRRV